MSINPISYPGNKNRLINQLVELFDKQADSFVDVFCGSGVVAVNSNQTNIVLNDISKEAVELLKYFYETSFEKIVYEIENIISKYDLTYTRVHSKDYYKIYNHEGLSNYNRIGYEKLKKDYNTIPTVQKLLVLLIYGFNHYIRFNKKGIFNVPVGKVDFSDRTYKNLKIFLDDLKRKKVEFFNKDFRDESLYSSKDSLYYFDPPYLITTAPYNNSWSENDEIELLFLLDKLHENGIKFALSNVLLSNGKRNTILEKWSSKYNIHYLKRQYRNANYQKINITDSIEVLITNY